MMRVALLLSVFYLWLVQAIDISITDAIKSGPVAAYNLQTEYLTNPIGIDVPTPRFVWTVGHSDRSQAQTTFQVQVATSASFGSAVIWDTGKVTSGDFAVVYAGPALTSDTSYFWQVTWWDSASTQTSWSQANFDTGLLSQSDWAGKWIGGQNNLYRKEFTMSAVPKRARAFISGLGYYELYLNGQRVGDYRLDVGWTEYSARALYNVYDVTSLLLEGNNTVGVMLGHGWYASTEAREPNGPLSLIMHISADGQVAVSSDSTWFTSPGPITYDGIYNGETYDARLEQPGWDANGFEQGAGWSQAGYVNGPGGMLSYQAIPPVLINANLTAKNITEPGNNSYVIDFGQNFSGWCVLTINGTAGTTISLRHGEVLLHDGSGNIYFDNLRSAKATDTYILKGNPDGEVYMPRFTYHGFRFVEFQSNPPIVPTLETLVAMHAYSSVPQTGSITFQSSSPTLNQVQHNILWGQQSNLMSVPTDCDQRDERKGWMGDAQLSAEEALHNFYMPGFYQHFVNLIVDDMVDGQIPDTVPWTFGGRPADPAWSSAYSSILYWLYTYWGDTNVLARHYPYVIEYIDFMIAQASKTGLANMYASYGDWVPPPPAAKCSVHLTSAFSLLANLEQVIEIANALGNTSDVAYYTKAYQSFAAEYNTAFLDTSSNNYDTGLQSANALSLWLGIVPSDNVNNVTNNLLNNVVSVSNTHLSTGIIGTKYLMEALHMIGRDDLALQLAENVDYPSWGYMINNPIETPATTLWELWDSPNEGPGMNSRNHIMFGSVGAWYYKALAGIDHAYHDTTFKDIQIAPSVVGDLTAVSASFLSGRGNISSEWSLMGGSRVCGRAAENKQITLDCASIGAEGVITEIQFASFGTPRGACGNYGEDETCHAPSSKSVVEQQCLGKSSCVFEATAAAFGNPCAAFKRMHVQAVCSKAAAASLSLTTGIPVGSSSVVILPVLDFANVTITESGSTIWANGKYQSGATGVQSATKQGSTIVIGTDSGSYQFSLTGSAATTVCVGPIAEKTTTTITCPQSNQQITRVQFASFGTPSGTCSTAFQPGTCNAGSSKHQVEQLCLNRNSCDIYVGDLTFGDPCFNTVKTFVAQVSCARI